MKDLYNQIGEGFRVRLILADHPNARQIIAVPANFASTVIEKKQQNAKQFNTPHETTIRTLTENERQMYLSQYQEKAGFFQRPARHYTLDCPHSGRLKNLSSK